MIEPTNYENKNVHIIQILHIKKILIPQKDS